MVNETFRLGKFLVFITDENKSTKFSSIESRKNSRVSGAKDISFLGHISESDYGTHPSGFAKPFLYKLPYDDYNFLKDKILDFARELPESKFIHAMIYRINR